MVNETNNVEGDDRVEDTRRNFLKKAAKIAVYTPPAMMVMSRPSYATIKTTGGQEYQHVAYSHYQHSRFRRVRYSFFRRFFSFLHH